MVQSRHITHSPEKGVWEAELECEINSVIFLSYLTRNHREQFTIIKRVGFSTWSRKQQKSNKLVRCFEYFQTILPMLSTAVRCPAKYERPANTEETISLPNDFGISES